VLIFLAITRFQLQLLLSENTLLFSNRSG